MDSKKITLKSLNFRTHCAKKPNHFDAILKASVRSGAIILDPQAKLNLVSDLRDVLESRQSAAEVRQKFAAPANRDDPATLLLSLHKPSREASWNFQFVAS
jgi:hypothetical protein